ncbi:MAG: sigma-70 family RNA polymerase sigma factor [Saprospiraceae bacterium]
MLANLLSQLSDGQLVLRYQKERRPEFFDVLYRRYSKKVFLYCYKIMGHREDALDVSSEVFVQAFEKLDTLREAITFRAWLFRIACHKSINACIRKQRTATYSIDNIFYVSASTTATDWQDYEEKEAQTKNMMAALAALPAETQTLLKAKYYDGESIEALMERYHLSKSAVKMRLARAREQANIAYGRA